MEPNIELFGDDAGGSNIIKCAKDGCACCAINQDGVQAFGDVVLDGLAQNRIVHTALRVGGYFSNIVAANPCKGGVFGRAVMALSGGIDRHALVDACVLCGLVIGIARH